MTASRQNNESYGPKTDEMAVFGPFFINGSGKEGKCGQGKENQSQLGRRDAKTGRRDGKRSEGMNAWEERKRKRGRQGLEKREKKQGKRGRRGLEKRETGIGKEGNGDWKRGRKGRTSCSLQSETRRENLLTVLLCYQQKGSRY